MSARSADAGPSSPITTPVDHTSGVHLHPHAAHLQGGEDEEDHDYESLPVGAGWGVNMAAGALVSFRHLMV